MVAMRLWQVKLGIWKKQLILKQNGKKAREENILMLNDDEVAHAEESQKNDALNEHAQASYKNKVIQMEGFNDKVDPSEIVKFPWNKYVQLT